MSRRNIRLIFVITLISLACYQKAGTARNRYADTFAEAMRAIDAYYVEPVERRSLFEAAMAGMTDALDAHSSYVPPVDFNEFQVSLEQEFGGIGIQVAVDEAGQLTVLSPLVGTPAYEAGVLAGDKILLIEDQSTEGFDINDAVRLLRGKPGSQVSITVGRKGLDEPIEIDIERDVIQIETIMGDTHNPDGSWNFRLADHPDVGYIRITSFSERTIDELRVALNELLEQGIDGLILDLRNNPGGLLDTAVEACDLFIPDGKIVSTRGRDGRELEVFEAGRKGTYGQDFPIAILVSRFSASASEIFAACLQDHGRAIVVGERTFGKGTVQNLFNLEQGQSALKLTIATYWRPSGRNIDRRPGATEADDWGVTPDEGYQRDLTDDEFRELLEWRRDRDVVRSSQSSNGQATKPVDEIDPQLKLAIEAITGATEPAESEE